MHNRFGVMMTAATFALLVVAVSSAHACMDHGGWAKYGTLPGAWILNPHASLAIAALAAVIERPFLTWAGVSKHALAHSFVASAITFLVINVGGLLAMAAAGPMVGAVVLLWLPGSVFVAAWIKFAWLNQRRSIFHDQLRGGPIVGGVIVSHIAIACLPIWQSIFGFDDHNWAWSVQDVRFYVAVLTVPAALIAVLSASRRIADDWNAVAPEKARGFEVLPASSASEPVVSGLSR